MAEHLTIQREGFVQDLLKGESQRTAYKNNYSCKNMKDKTIDEAASRLLKNSKVNARYEELRSKVAEKIEEEFMIDIDEILKDIVEVKDRCMQKVPVQIKVNGEWVDSEEWSFEHMGALKALDMLGKYKGMWVERIKSENTNKNVNLEVDSIEEADRIINEFNKMNGGK